MHCQWLALSLFSIFTPRVISAPVLAEGTAELKRSLSRRAVSGPKISGKNFPDPSIINFNDKWYAFATRTIGSSIHVQIATSDDFETWDMVQNDDGSQRDALPDLPSWVAQDSSDVWAPDINILSDGSLVLYYSASVASDPSKHCVGAATSNYILGPYVPMPETLFCDLSRGGAIDAAGYEENGQRYVVYKVDGNSIGNGGDCGNTVAPLQETPIILAPVSSDGLTAQGEGTTLLQHQGPSDDGIIEAPSLIKSGGTYFLFFSPGCFTTDNYAVSYATASSLQGPYSRASQALIQSGTDLSGPGGADVTRDGKQLVFHANNANGRAMRIAYIGISGTAVSVL